MEHFLKRLAEIKGEEQRKRAARRRPQDWLERHARCTLCDRTRAEHDDAHAFAAPRLVA